MKTINLKKYNFTVPMSALVGLLAALLLWLLIDLLQTSNATMGTVDPAILQVIILAISVWLIILVIAFSIIGRLLFKLHNLLETVKALTSWQQQITYLALFAVLVLSGTGCLIAIC